MMNECICNIKTSKKNASIFLFGNNLTLFSPTEEKKKKSIMKFTKRQSSQCDACDLDSGIFEEIREWF